MKFSRTILLLSSVPLLAACELKMSESGKICPPRHVTVIKKGGSETNPASLEVKPAIIRVREGCSFRINFSGATIKTESGENLAEEGRFIHITDHRQRTGRKRPQPLH